MNNISVRHGTEGPWHDPYSFTEITFEGRLGKTTVHLGLAEWIEHNGVRRDDQNAYVRFKALTGLTPDQAERIYYTLPYRRHSAKCGGRDFHDMAGYPGESLTVCAKCGDVVDSHFDRSAIE